MLKLMQLEMKKFRFGGYIKGAIITNLIFVAFILFIVSVQKAGQGEDAFFGNYEMSFLLMDILVKATFIVFASVIIARLVIEEYKSGTIILLFTYPISRKKLIAVKLLIVFLFTLISIIITEIIVKYVIVQIDYFYDFLPGKLTKAFIIKDLISTVLGALTSASMSLISLFFGMLKKSVPATILSSLIMVSILSSGNNGNSLSTIIAIPIILSVVGVLIAGLSIRNIEHVDVIK